MINDVVVKKNLKNKKKSKNKNNKDNIENVPYELDFNQTLIPEETKISQL